MTYTQVKGQAAETFSKNSQTLGLKLRARAVITNTLNAKEALTTEIKL